MNLSYDPVEFISKIGLLTIALTGSFITLKLLNAIYENLYEPIIDAVTDSEKSDQYYVLIGKNYVQVNMILKEFIKWFILVILLMIVYNLISNNNAKCYD